VIDEEEGYVVMSLFDDLGKKIATAGQGTVKMAKDRVGMSRLNGQINEEQRAITASYTQIGERYYQMYGEAPGDAFAQDCARVSDGIARIAEMSAEIQKLKNVRACPKCGSECVTGAMFCGVCGQQLTVAAHGAVTTDGIARPQFGWQDGSQDTVTTPYGNAAQSAGAGFGYQVQPQPQYQGYVPQTPGYQQQSNFQQQQPQPPLPPPPIPPVPQATAGGIFRRADARSHA
jgi:hypothetical protein